MGLINENKSQHILVEAIDKLDEEVKKKARFTFCGDFGRVDLKIAEKIIGLVSRNRNVKLIDQLPHNQLLELYDKMDSVVVTSKEEAIATIMAEGLMKEMVGICSDTCGITAYLENGRDAYIYSYGDSDKLAEIITYVVNNYHCLEDMRKCGRKVYEEIYSEKAFIGKIDQIIKWTENK